MGENKRVNESFEGEERRIGKSCAEAESIGTESNCEKDPFSLIAD